MTTKAYPVTPDGRYFVVNGTLWRCSNPALKAEDRAKLVSRLMKARSAVGKALRDNDADALAAARRAVDRAKRQLGERGKVWWTDGSPDFNRHRATNTPYRAWFEKLTARSKPSKTTASAPLTPRRTARASAGRRRST